MKIEITDLPEGRLIQNVKVDITFEGSENTSSNVELTTTQISTPSTPSSLSTSNTSNETVTSEKFLNASSDIDSETPSIPEITKEREHKEIPSEMLDAEF